MGGKAHGGSRSLLDIARAFGESLTSELRGVGACSRAEVAGSIRRGLPEVGDVDLVVEPADLEVLNQWLTARFGSCVQQGKKPLKPKRSGLINGIQVDVLIATPGGWGAALMHYTGSKETNVAQRALAKSRGWLLSEKGLFEAGGGERLAGESEEDVYNALGLPFQAPDQR